MRNIAAIATGIGIWTGAATAGEIPKILVLKAPDGGIQPQAVADAEGTIHLIAFKGEPAAGDLFYSRLKPDGERISAPIRVNSEPKSAVALGTIRGGQIVLGKGGRIHVAWNGSMNATPKNPIRGAPMLYSRLKDDKTGFEPQRNLMTHTFGLDGGGSVAADGSGNVVVAWHGRDRDSADGEGNRKVWLARSKDDGLTFADEVSASDRPTGACGCCGLKASLGPAGDLAILYRSASGGWLDRDMNLLSAGTPEGPIRGVTLHRWRLGACPMSSASIAEGLPGFVLAWETAGQVYFDRLDPGTGTPSAPIPAPGDGKGRKHPALASNASGETLLVWDEGTGWGRGGDLVWQAFDSSGRPTEERGRIEGGIPSWGLATVVARRDGGFVVVH